MPYLPSSARKKSDYYQKILDSDIIEQQELVRSLKANQQESGSIDANNVLRDVNGILVSVESPFNKGKASEESFEQIRLENKQQFFDTKNVSKIDTEFEFFRPPVEFDKPDDVIEKEEIQEELDDEIRKGKLNIPLRNMMIRFVNRALRENNPMNVNGSILNSRLTKIFKEHLKPSQKLFASDTLLRSRLIPGLIKPFKAPKLKFTIGSLFVLKRLQVCLNKSDYQKIYDEFIFTNSKLRGFWAEANEKAPRKEFDMFNVSGLEDTVEEIY